MHGSGSSNGKALVYRLDGLGSIPGVVGMEIFLRSFVSTHPPTKWLPRRLCTRVNAAERRTSQPPLWSRGNSVVPHLAGAGSIPVRVSFPSWGFFRIFSSTVRQMSGKLGSHPSPDIISHHNHHKSFHTGANDLRCRCAVKVKTQILHSSLSFSIQRFLFFGFPHHAIFLHSVYMWLSNISANKLFFKLN